MKKLFLIFILLNFTSGCAWYNHHFHHDNGLHRGHHKDHHDKGNDNDQGNKHHGKKGKHHKDHD